MPLPQKKLIPGILLMLVIAALASPPLWWGNGNPPVIDPAAAQNNHGPANIGQAKHMAKSALDALRPILPAVAAQIEADLAPIVDLTIPPDPKPADWADKQKAPLLIGQLKAIADPFYTRLHAAAPEWLAAQRTENATNHPNSIFPWTAEATDDANKAIANIGQLKAVFSLHFDSLPPIDPNDTDGDELPNDWEIANGLDPNDPNDASADLDGDGLSNLAEYEAGTFPDDFDSDCDGMSDGWEITNGLGPLDSYDGYSDPDGDGIWSQYEYVLDFDPNNASTGGNPDVGKDRDGDDMPDFWEAADGDPDGRWWREKWIWDQTLGRQVFVRNLDWEINDANEDPDGDVLTNLFEFSNGLFPMILDSDGDYLPDGWEVQHGFDPVNAWETNDDPDGDGIANQYEYVLGFDPNNANTGGNLDAGKDRDGDGMPDWWEAMSGAWDWDYGLQRYVFTKALDWEVDDGNGDLDNDGLINSQELVHGTKPKIWDTDGDFLPDGWEIQNGLVAAYEIQVNGVMIYGSSGVNGRTGDPDGDGIQNQHEYVLGLNPKNTITGGIVDTTRDGDSDGIPDWWEAAKGTLNSDGTFQRKLDWENPADATLDPDTDGLHNLAEYQNTTDLNDYDTDGDNLSDGWEISHGLNPKSILTTNGATGDPDADGIQNQYEQVLGFDPNSSITGGIPDATRDRDSDGMPDAWEAATSAGRHTAPATGTGVTRLIRLLDWERDDAVEDYDSDGLANLLEYQAGTDPTDPDSDDDFLSDGWEILHGFNPLVAALDALTADPDGDGFSNFMESLFGTDPFDAASHPPDPPDTEIPTPPQPPSPPSSPPAPPTPAPVAGSDWHFEIDNSSKYLPKYGYAEFVASTPPKRYLKQTEIVSFGLHGECDPPESSINGTRITTIAELDGKKTVDDRQHPGNNNMGGATKAKNSTVTVGVSQVTSYDDEPNSKGDCDATKTYTLKLAEENTTDKLLANTLAKLPAYTGNFSQGTPHAYRNLIDDELGLSYKRVKYKLKWNPGVATSSRHPVKFLLIFQPETPTGATGPPPAEVVRVKEWDGNAPESPEFEIDPETERPKRDGSYYLLYVDIEEVISDQIAGNKANKLPTAFYKGEPNNPMLMATRSGVNARLIVKMNVTSTSASNILVGARIIDSDSILGSVSSVAPPGSTTLSFNADVGHHIYEVVAGYDTNSNGVLETGEITVVFAKTPKTDSSGAAVTTNTGNLDKIIIVTQSAFNSGKSTIIGYNMWTTDYAGDLISAFAHGSTLVSEATTTSPHVITSTQPGLSHPVGARWSPSLSAETHRFSFYNGSEAVDDIKESNAFSQVIESAISTNITAIRSASGSSWTYSGPYTFSESRDFIKTDSEWVGVNELGYAFGKVTFTGTMHVSSRWVAGGKIEVGSVVYTSQLDDVFDVTYWGGPKAREASLVQAGHATLAGASEPNSGQVFFTRAVFSGTTSIDKEF